MARYNSDGALVVVVNGESGTDPSIEAIAGNIGDWESADIDAGTPASTDTIFGWLKAIWSNVEQLYTLATGGGYKIKPAPVGAMEINNGTVTSGGTSQQLAAANSNRVYLEIANNSSADLWIQFVSSAGVDDGFRIPAGGVWYSPQWAVPLGAVSIFGATTGQKFSWWQEVA